MASSDGSHGASTGGDRAFLAEILDLLADRIETGVFVSLADGRMVYANQCIARMARYPSVEAFRQVRASDLYVDAEARTRLLEQLKQTGRVRRLETRSRRLDGSIYWVAISAVLTEAGGQQAIVGTVHDITEQKEAELALAQSEERYRLLVEHSPEAVYVHRDGKFVFANRAGLVLLGVRDGTELIGTPILDRVHPDDRDAVLARIQRSLQAAEPAPLREERFVRLDGSVVSVEVIGVAVTFEGRPAMLVMARDVTARHEAEERLQKSQRLESLGVLAGGIAHDFNNLLAGIYGHVELAARALARGQEADARQNLREVQEVMTRATHLTGQLLTFAKGGAPARSPGELGPVVESAVRFALSGSSVKGEVAVAPSLSRCSFDMHQLSQVVDNIVINAVQAMPRGGVLRVRVDNVDVAAGSTLAVPPGRYVRMSFADEGVGIPAEILPRIFDPFFTTRPDGNGLGLATSWSIIHRHGGTIEVSSRVGSGTTVHCYLPATDESSAPSRPAPAALPGRGRVLFMDDEAYLRRVVADMLAAAGFEVVVAADGAEATARYREALQAGRRFDIVVVDLTVPGGMGGVDTLRAIRAIDGQARVVASSGYAYDPIMADPGAFGFTAGLAKPYTLAAMTDVLRAVLGSDPGRDPRPA